MSGQAKDAAEACGAFIAKKAMGLSDANPTEAVLTLPQAAADNLVPLFDRHSFSSGLVRITHAGLAQKDGRAGLLLEGGEDVELTLRLEAEATVDGLLLGFTLKDRLGQAVAGENTLGLEAPPITSMRPGAPLLARPQFTLPQFAEGEYVLACAVASGTQAQHVQHHWVHEALVLQVRPRRSVGALVATPLPEGRVEPLA